LKTLAIAMIFLWSLLSTVQAQPIDSNYADRRPFVVNTSPHVELSGFSFQNKYNERRTRFETAMKWKNIGSQPIIAFEIVILKYDAFNRRLIGERWTVTGTNSANWTPLAVGASSGDGTIGFGEELVFTGIAYVRAVRLADGSVWEVNPGQLLADIRKAVPVFKDFGKLEPDQKGKTDGS
jgi:hypothetical protein